jgi:hypothetical protein
LKPQTGEHRGVQNRSTPKSQNSRGLNFEPVTTCQLSTRSTLERQLAWGQCNRQRKSRSNWTPSRLGATALHNRREPSRLQSSKCACDVHLSDRVRLPCLEGECWVPPSLLVSFGTCCHECASRLRASWRTRAAGVVSPRRSAAVVHEHMPKGVCCRSSKQPLAELTTHAPRVCSFLPGKRRFNSGIGTGPHLWWKLRNWGVRPARQRPSRSRKLIARPSAGRLQRWKSQTRLPKNLGRASIQSRHMRLVSVIAFCLRFGKVWDADGRVVRQRRFSRLHLVPELWWQQTKIEQPSQPDGPIGFLGAQQRWQWATV